MPAKPRKLCPCGCGQAPSVSCRQRLVRCACGNLARQSREAMARGPLGCPCGGQLEPACLWDRAESGDESAYAEVVARESKRHAPKRLGGVRRIFQCHGCKRLLKSPLELCRGCGFDNNAQRYVEGVSSSGEAMAF